MVNQSNQRRLSAILAADVVEYTRHMERDSYGTVAAWQQARELLDFLPAFSLERFRFPQMFKRADDRERVIDALCKTGLPK